MPIALRMDRLTLLLTLVLCLPLIAHADEASRRAKAQQLVALLHTDRMVQQASASIMQQVSDAAQSATGSNPTPENKARLDDFEKKVSQMLDAQLGWKAMEPAFTDLYATTFTEQQLDAIVAFYRTPAGAALVEKIPAIDDQVSQLAHSKLDAIQPQMNQLFDDFRAGLAETTLASPATPVATSPAVAPTPPAPATPATSPAAAPAPPTNAQAPAASTPK